MPGIKNIGTLQSIATSLILSLIFFNVVAKGMSWSPPAVLPIITNPSNDFSLAVDANGGWHLVYFSTNQTSYQGGFSQKVSVQYLNSYGQSDVVAEALYAFDTNTGSTGELVSSPEIAVGPDGQLHIAYYASSNDTGQTQIRYTTKFGGSWSPPAVLPIITNPSNDFSLAVDANGGWHLVYFSTNQTSYQGGFSQKVSVQYLNSYGQSDVVAEALYAFDTNTGSTGELVSSPEIAVGPDGQLHIAYYASSNDTGQTQIRYTTKFGGSWSPPAVLPIITNPSNDFSLAVDANGGWHLVYFSTNQTSYQGGFSQKVSVQYLNSYGQSDVVAEALYAFDTNTGSTGELVSSPEIAVGPDGQLHIAYYASSNDTGQTQIRYTTTNNQDIFWANSVSGSWDITSNWNPQLTPSNQNNTTIAPGGAVIVTGPASPATVQSLTIGASTGGLAELQLQPSGNLSVLNALNINTTGSLTTNGANISAASVTDDGIFNLSGGTGTSLSVDNEFVGYNGTGTFIQKGGSHIVNGTLTVADNPGSHGTFELKGGALKAGAIVVNSGGAFTNRNCAINLTGATVTATPTGGIFSQIDRGYLNVQLNGTGNGQFGQLVVGKAHLGGHLTVTLGSNYNETNLPAHNSTFSIISTIAGQTSGTFNSGHKVIEVKFNTVDPYNNGRSAGLFDIDYDSNGVTLSNFHQIHVLSFGYKRLNSYVNGMVAAQGLYQAFAKLPGVTENRVLKKDSSTPGIDNYQAYVTQIGQMQSAGIRPGDTYVFYINTHGVFDKVLQPFPAEETIITRQYEGTFPFYLDTSYKTNSQTRLEFGTPGVVKASIFARLFSGDPNWNSDPNWKKVNKLFIMDTCYAGGFWTGAGGHKYLSAIDKTGFIGASLEEEISQGNQSGGVLGQAVVDVLGQINRAGDKLNVDNLLSRLNTTTVARFHDQVGWAQEDISNQGAEDNPLPFVNNTMFEATSDFEFELVGFDPNGNAIKGDIDTDGKVDFNDLSIMADQWLSMPGIPSADIAPDGGDGIVNLLDFAKLADNWLQDTHVVDPFVGILTMTQYGDDDISDGVTIEPSDYTMVTSTNNGNNYNIELFGTTVSMLRDGNDLLALNPQPQYFDTWMLPNVYVLSDGSNVASVWVGKDPGPLDISFSVGTWAPPATVTGSQLAGKWKIKWVYNWDLKDDLLAPFTVETETLSITDLGNGQVSVHFDDSDTTWLMNINGNKLEPVAEPIDDPSVVYFSMVTDGKGIAISIIGVETYDSTDVSATIGLAAPVH